jgi:hypothetical protein
MQEQDDSRGLLAGDLKKERRRVTPCSRRDDDILGRRLGGQHFLKQGSLHENVPGRIEG